MKERKRIKRDILNVLYWAQRPLTTSEVAKYADISWNTAKKYLQRLYQQRYVKRGEKGNAIYWWLRV